MSKPSLMRRWCYMLAAPVLAVALAPALCQTTFNEREVKSLPSALDKADVWAMDFRFKDPRIIKVNVPGRGTRIIWYLWYQLVNRTGKARDVAPYFELVTLDPPATYPDEIIPTAEEAIRRVEDRTGYQEIKNSVWMSKAPIPPSKAPDEAFPRAVTGVAIWDATAADPKKRDRAGKDLSTAARFSIFVRGLSNGFVEVDAPAPGLPPITQYKTLQLNFVRRGDRFSTDSRDIQFVPPAQWIYRAAGRTIPAIPAKGAKKAPPAKAADAGK